MAEKESLQKSMHKQQIQQKMIQQKKDEVKNAYNFDMLNTDDSTDDEAKPVSQKRPPPPLWSKSKIIHIIQWKNNSNNSPFF